MPRVQSQLAEADTPACSPPPPRLRRPASRWLKRPFRVAGRQLVAAVVRLRAAGPRRGPEPVRFVLVGDGRMGSELLVDLLRCHPQVACEGEILDLPVFDPLGYAEARAALPGKPVYGFKLLTYQMMRIDARRGGGLLDQFHRRGWKVVRMRRRNTLRQALSAMVSRMRKRWHSRTGEGPLGGRFEIDCDELRWRLHRLAVRGAAEEEAVAGIPHATVVYEEDLLPPERHPATAERVFRVLGLEPVAVATTYARITPQRIADFVANYHQVAAVVEGTGLACFLDGGGESGEPRNDGGAVDHDPEAGLLLC